MQFSGGTCHEINIGYYFAFGTIFVLLGCVALVQLVSVAMVTTAPLVLPGAGVLFTCVSLSGVGVLFTCVSLSGAGVSFTHVLPGVACCVPVCCQVLHVVCVVMCCVLCTCVLSGDGVLSTCVLCVVR